ncbi:hypothetical protein Tsac_2879 [Thermoanaerobacterium phage THSA-485A]|uniref:hypothetical protein n=1 Tax=Thermoanaerobacterium phage THSA-485A TaxID=1126885 RepID=UPI000263F8E7|nr:hypothetical protein Tsac_2879 [Thermoanaerobacterium phage THSA-485A]AFK87732.1 hypothetical protein Tsac_2879 [Thermoanaerobacterium phage THSA-485A]
MFIYDAVCPRCGSHYACKIRYWIGGQGWINAVKCHKCGQDSTYPYRMFTFVGKVKDLRAALQKEIEASIEAKKVAL